MQDYKAQYETHRSRRGLNRLRKRVLLLPLLVFFGTALYAGFGDQTAVDSPVLTSPDSTDPTAVKLIIPAPFDAETVEPEHTSVTISGPPGDEVVIFEPAPAVISKLPSVADRPTQPILPVEKSPAEIVGKWLTHKVRSGDTLARIFSKHGLSPRLLHKIVTSSKESARLAHIKPGQELRINIDQQGEFIALIQVIDAIHSLEIKRTTEGFSAHTIKQPVEYRTAFASGTITQSLFLAAKEAGLSDPLIMSLADIFGWDIDFALEIRSGDRFTVIYQEEYLNGKKLRNGAILAAEFTNRGKSFQAVRYVNEKGDTDYFSPEGKSVRKAFLRSPVDFRRISSRFQRARYHPVLGKKRPHRGVDYAATTGTPIKASGDGKIIFRGRKGGYGKAVIIQHGGGITTLYAHLNSFMLKRKKSSRVRQGETIGFVGKTGLASGPHLHYEFRLNGVHRNPLTVKLPAASPIAKKYRDDFKAQTEELTNQLATLSRVLLADAQP